MDFEDLREETGFGTTETGEDLSAETVRRMACEAEVIPTVLGTDGAVLDVGRAQRLVTAVIWLALVARDQHCRFPNCTRPPIMCHAHHLIHWIDGGVTSLENLILLCGHHHRLIHAGPWEIRRTGPNSYAFDPPPGTRRMSTTGREPPDDRRSPPPWCGSASHSPGFEEHSLALAPRIHRGLVGLMSGVRRFRDTRWCCSRPPGQDLPLVVGPLFLRRSEVTKSPLRGAAVLSAGRAGSC